MWTLVCALVGVRGRAFPVDIDECKLVGHLKEAIKSKNEDDLKTVDANHLQLYVARKGETWLPDDDGNVPLEIQAIVDGEPMKATRTLRRWLCDKCKMPEPTTDEIHVLVVVPTDVAVVRPRTPIAVPMGPEVDLYSPELLLAFLEGEMIKKAGIVSNSHILSQESLQFRLVGREDTNAASKCFKKIIAHAKTTATDRTQVPIPVCSGMSGLGKTRMLEESGAILEAMELDPSHVARVIISYSNGFTSQLENSMPIEASFSWRLLYRLFLDKNCDLEFGKWFQSRLPRNGVRLTLRCAVSVIERKLREKLQEPSTTLYLFLGVDEYEKIERVGGQQTGCGSTILRELVESVTCLLCTQSASLIVLPMFAGTAIEPRSLATCYYVTEHLPK